MVAFFLCGPWAKLTFETDAAVIRSRLPVISTPASAPLSIAAPQQQQVSLPPQQVSVGRVVPAIPAATKPQTPKNLARALWDYSSATPGDLNFAKGDVIEILAEENEHVRAMMLWSEYSS